MDTAATLKELETKRRAAQRGYLLFGLMNLVLILFLLTRRMGTALVILALELVYYFFLARPDIKSYAAVFREKNAAAAMAKHMEKAAYQSRSGISREVILADRLLPVKPGNSCMTFHRITGEKDRMELELSDVSFQLDAGEERSKPQFLTGCWVRVKLDHSSGRSLRMVARTLVDPELQRDWFQKHSFHPIGWEREPLDGLFCSYAGEGAAFSLPEAVLARIDELARTVPASFALGIEGDTLFFMLHRRYVTCGDPGLKRPLTQADLERDPLPELEQIIGLARACRRMDPPEQDG